MPAAAVSRFRRGGDLPWERSAATLDAVLHAILAEPPGPGAFWNANLPHPDDTAARDPHAAAEVVRCRPEAGPLPVKFERVHDAPPGAVAAYRYRGSYPERTSAAGSDVAVCFGGAAALTRVALFA